LLIFLGIFRLGSWIKLIPHSLITGFTSGIALIIFSSQVRDFFGLNMGTPPAALIQKWGAYFAAMPSLHLPTFFLGLGTFTLILSIRKFIPKIPWGIAVIVLATSVSYFLGLNVETIQSKFGQIPNKLP